MQSPAQIDGGSSKRNLIIAFKNISYMQKMFSKAQIHLKSPPRPNFAIIPPPFNIKNMPDPTPPSELPENPKIKFKNYRKELNIDKEQVR